MQAGLLSRAYIFVGLAAAVLVCIFSSTAGLTVIFSTDGYGNLKVRVWQNSSGVITATGEEVTGFFGNTTIPAAFVPFPNGQGVFFHYNYSAPEHSVTPVANNIQSVLDSPLTFVLNATFDAPRSASIEGFMPNDEGSRYYYYASSGAQAFFYKIDLTTQEVVQDAFWPVPDVCGTIDFGEDVYVAGIAFNDTHFFISCYGYPAGLLLAYPRADPSRTNRRVISSTSGQYGTITTDDTYLYLSQWPGLTIHRYNFRTGNLSLGWSTLVDYGQYLNGYGPWRLRMYKENGVYVLWAQMYPAFDSESNCLRRVNVDTGVEMSVVVAANISCPAGLSDFFIVPEAGGPIFVTQPVALPPPVAPPINPPVAPPVASPVAPPVAMPAAVPVSAPVAAPVTAAKAPTKPTTPAASASTLALSSIVCIILSTASLLML